MYSEIEREAANWVLEQADDGILITNDDVKEKALEIAKWVNLPNLKASDGWIDRLKKRKGISLRMVTHTTVKTEFSEKDLVNKFGC